jgi:nucleoside-triphosphatase THEP1
MRVLITGARGSGKTTCCVRVVDLLRTGGIEPCGFITHKDKDRLIIEDVKTSETAILAEEKLGGGERVGKYLFSDEGIEFGVESLKRSGDVSFADEIGRLELGERGFYRAFPILRERENTIVTCRDSFAEPVRSVLHLDNVAVELIDEKNRDSMPERVTLIYENASFHHGSRRH